jgi:hypothetical protein
VNVTEVIYSENDPCIDLYCSSHYKEIVLGARRYSAKDGVALDCFTHRLSLWPTDRELGGLLTSMLMSPQSIGVYDSDRPWSITSARSLDDFKSAFWPFVVWTKRAPAIPLIIGAPISEHYPDTFSRKPIDRKGSPESIGSEVIRFITEVATELGRAGLEKWE